MNLENIFRLWHKIAVAAFIFTALMVVTSNLMEYVGKNQCKVELFVDPRVDNNSKLLAALFFSGFMVLFFHNVRTSPFTKKATDLLRSARDNDVRIISDRIPLTYLHISFYLPIILFCLFTLIIPILSIIIFLLNAVRCNYL